MYAVKKLIDFKLKIVRVFIQMSKKLEDSSYNCDKKKMCPKIRTNVFNDYHTKKLRCLKQLLDTTDNYGNRI